MPVIPDNLMQDIRRHAEVTYPDECCGALLGIHDERRGTVRMALPMTNSRADSRGRRFLITPSQYIEAEQSAATHRCDLLGFYHSHPDHPAVPSDFDTAHALPALLSVIISVVRGKAETVSAWILTEDRRRYEEQPIQIRHTHVEEG